MTALKIKERDFTIAMICFLQGSTLFTIFFAPNLKWEAWIPALAGIVLTLPLIWVYSALATTFSGKSLCGINEIVFGKAAGKIISCMYIFYFIEITVLSTDNIGSFFSDYIMPETPKAVFFIMIIVVCSFAVRSGIENIMKMGFVLLAFVTVSVVVNILLLANKINLKNFLPVFSQEFIKYVQSVHTVVTMPFGEVVVFLMFTHITSGNIKRGYLLGFLIGALSILIIIIRDISVLGVAMSIVSVPSYEALRLIDISNILTRIEVLISFNMVIMSFMKISVLYCAIVEGIAEVAGTKDYKHQVWAMGVIIICFAVLGFESGYQEVEYGMSYHAFFATPFTIILPIATLITAKLRRLKTV
ncbi:MAG: endospore germination permease [Clostridia bacterium]|nr:endospore germination permease [Clostridia bacterium]